MYRVTKDLVYKLYDASIGMQIRVQYAIYSLCSAFSILFLILTLDLLPTTYST